MKLELNTLKCAKILTEKGWDRPQAEALIETLTEIPIRNIYGKDEIDIMLPESVERVFREAERRHQEQVRENYIKHKELIRRNERELDFLQQRFSDEIREIKREGLASRRWMAGVIITCTLGLAGYLSALIKLSH